MGWAINAGANTRARRWNRQRMSGCTPNAALGPIPGLIPIHQNGSGTIRSERPYLSE